MKRKPPNECVSRLQDGCHVSLLLYDRKHEWWISPMRPNGRPAIMKQIRVRIDRPLDQQELFRWLEKTQPIE